LNDLSRMYPVCIAPDQARPLHDSLALSLQATLCARVLVDGMALSCSVPGAGMEW